MPSSKLFSTHSPIIPANSSNTIDDPTRIVIPPAPVLFWLCALSDSVANLSSGFGSWRKESDWQVARRSQSRWRTQDHWNRIHRYTGSRNVAMRPAGNRQRNIGMPSQSYRVSRIFRTDVHLQFHVDQFLAA